MKILPAQSNYRKKSVLKTQKWMVEIMLDKFISVVIIPVGLILSTVYFVGCYRRGENPFIEEIECEE